jgi:hypothetical protein
VLILPFFVCFGLIYKAENVKLVEKLIRLRFFVPDIL